MTANRSRNLAVGVLLLVSGLGCRSVSVGPIDLEPAIHERVSMDRAFIETSALKGDWSALQKHLLKVDPSSLPREDQIYALYWMGASHYNLHQYQAASAQWQRAESMGPTGAMAQMLEKAQHALRSYGHPGESVASLEEGRWALQYGIFSLKKGAEDLARNLSWHGTELQIDEMRHRGQPSWVVWSGPYTGNQAEQKMGELRSKKVSCIIKPLESIKP